MPKCPTCSKQLSTENGVKMHHKQVHNESIRGVEICCDNCSKEIRIQEYRVNRSEYNYCSDECHYEHREETWTGDNHPHWSKEEMECDECSKTFYVHGYRASNARFCSHNCYAKSMEKNGPDGYGTEWTEVRQSIREQYNHKCIICDSKCQENHHHVHHIIPVRDFENPSNAHKNSNLVLLCKKHHPIIECLNVAEQCERLNVPKPNIQI